MNFAYHLPVDIRFGAGVVENSAAAFKSLGVRAYVVTGKTSGRKSGALQDVLDALEKAGVAAETFEGIGNNPEVEQCRELGAKAREFKADFIVGIGGGSPMDAAKAVAAFAANPELSAAELLKNAFPVKPLPVAAVPTTSGTGSEATPWSIMTWHEVRTKKSFGNIDTYPRLALLDPGYTRALPLAITRHTAMDAFQHAFESVISHKSSPITDAINYEALRRFAACMEPLEKGNVDDIREELMLISLMAGSTIAHTGTTTLHSLGYPLTYFMGLAHGHANSVMMPAYLDELKKHEPVRLERALTAMGMSFDTLHAYIRRNYPMPKEIAPDEEMLSLWAQQTSEQGAVRNTDIPRDPAYLAGIYKRALSE